MVLDPLLEGSRREIPDKADRTPAHEPTAASFQNSVPTAPADSSVTDQGKPTSKLVSPLFKTARKRNKVHLAFVAAQPCLICKGSPCDAHHLKFAQPRSLGRKVSDEFTVPLCREHHQQLHRHGNEMAWWVNNQIAPVEVAKDLWQMTLLNLDNFIATGRIGEITMPKP
jgi:hypothetical protein